MQSDDAQLTIGKTVIASLPQRRQRRAGLEAAGDESGGGVQAEADDAEEHFALVEMRDTESFEYLDHTADVIVHGRGKSASAALASAGLGMFGEMTNLELIEERESRHVEAEGRDPAELTFHLLDELLFLYGESYFIGRAIIFDEFTRGGKSDDDTRYRIRATVSGEVFDANRHEQGTEVKAITMHQLTVRRNGQLRTALDATEAASGNWEVFVLIDI
eukprot:Polyplicarium_translucidae@DN2417_c0_g1_i1.p2